MLTTVAKCKAPQRHGGKKEAEANARLIAAAPEMYDLLRWIASGESPESELSHRACYLLARIEGA